MKNIKAIVLILLTAVSIALVGCRSKIQVGDVWLYERNYTSEKSPFEDCNTIPTKHHFEITFKVLELKDGWVKAEDDSGHLACMTEPIFRVGAHKITQIKP